MPANPYLLRLHEMIASLTPDRFTQRYGCTGFQLEGPYGSCAHFHRGVDFVLPGGAGAGIFSFTSGVVVPSIHSGLGNSLEILAPNGYRVTVGHMRYPSLLRVGDPVLAGQFIGEQGSTGASTGAHVHLQYDDPNGRPINPTPTEWNSWARLWYTVFHATGAGMGYNPGQGVEVPPDPVTTTGDPIPLVNGLNFPTWEFANGVSDPTLPEAPPTTPPYYVDPTSTGGQVTGLPASWSWLTTNGGPVGAALASAGSGESTDGTGSCAQASIVLALVGVGAIFLIIGLYALTKEPPAQAVSQTVIAPVSDAAGAGVSISRKVALASE